MEITRGEVRAVGWVVKQVPTKFLEQGLCACSWVCGRALSCRSTTPDINIPLLLFSKALRNFFQNFTICFWCYRGSRFHKLDQQHSFSVPEHCCHQLSVCQWLFEFPGFIRWMCVHPLSRLLFDFHIDKLNPCFIACHNLVKKFVPLIMITLQKRQSWRHSLCFVNISEHFWQPSGTKLVVAKFFCDSFIQNRLTNLREFQWKFRDSELTSLANHFVNMLHKVISH